MPTGYKHTKEAKIKMSENKTGKPRNGNPENWKHTEETKKKLSLSLKGKPSWNKGTKGIMKPNKTSFKKGQIPWMKGRKHTLEAKNKLRENNLKYPKRYWLGKKRLEMSGKNHPNWKGGKSFEPYTTDWTEYLRESIRKRDNYVCQLCNKSQGDIAHDVHHIDYDKKNCNPDNLITLCHSCNSKVNFNRDYWTNYFNIKL